MRVLLRKKRSAVIAAIVLILLIALLGFVKVFAHLWTGQKPDTFREEYGLVLYDYGGEKVRMSGFRNKIMVAYAWASWCPYCMGELENLARLKEIYGDDVQVVAVNRAEPLAAARGYTDQLSKSAGVVFLLDPQDSFFKSIGGYAMPETVFIDDRGKVIFHQRGPMKFEEVSQKVRDLVGKR